MLNVASSMRNLFVLDIWWGLTEGNKRLLYQLGLSNELLRGKVALIEYLCMLNNFSNI